MSLRFLLVTVLMLAFAAAATTALPSGVAMDPAMAGDVDAGMPDCAACDGDAGSDAAAPCDTPCSMPLVALAGLAPALPAPTATAARPARHRGGLVGMSAPPDTTPPRSTRVA